MAGVRKGRGREFGRETTRKGGGRRGTVPFSVARLTRSRAPKFPLPLLTPATQAQPRPQGFSLKKWVGRENYERVTWSIYVLFRNCHIQDRMYSLISRIDLETNLAQSSKNITTIRN